LRDVSQVDVGLIDEREVLEEFLVGFTVVKRVLDGDLRRHGMGFGRWWLLGGRQKLNGWPKVIHTGVISQVWTTSKRHFYFLSHAILVAKVDDGERFDCGRYRESTWYKMHNKVTVQVQDVQVIRYIQPTPGW
jgi:hypothetical protein